MPPLCCCGPCPAVTDSTLSAGGVDGSLQLSAPSAAVRCHISRLNAASRLRCGSLQLSLAPGVGCRLLVRGPRAQLDPSLSALPGDPAQGLAVAGGGPLLVLESPQSARVQLQHWAAAAAGWT